MSLYLGDLFLSKVCISETEEMSSEFTFQRVLSCSKLNFQGGNAFKRKREGKEYTLFAITFELIQFKNYFNKIAYFNASLTKRKGNNV